MVKEKNTLGWTPLDESISYGDRSTSKLLERERERENLASIWQSSMLVYHCHFKVRMLHIP